MFPLSLPYYNASGCHSTTHQDLLDLAHSPCGAILTKSCTVSPRIGNPEPNYYFEPCDGNSLHATGIPNRGIMETLNSVRKIHELNTNKPIIVSVIPLQFHDVAILANILRENISYTQFPELNLNCPNVPGKPQIANSPEDFYYYLDEFSQWFQHPFGIKLPAYNDSCFFDILNNIIAHIPLVEYISCINGIGVSYYKDVRTGLDRITPRGGIGCLGGNFCYPIMLGNVKSWKYYFPKHVIGVGGIDSVERINETLEVGASAVQIGTHLQEHGTQIFNDFSSSFHKKTS